MWYIIDRRDNTIDGPYRQIQPEDVDHENGREGWERFKATFVTAPLLPIIN